MREALSVEEREQIERDERHGQRRRSRGHRRDVGALDGDACVLRCRTATIAYYLIDRASGHPAVRRRRRTGAFRRRCRQHPCVQLPHRRRRDRQRRRGRDRDARHRGRGHRSRSSTRRRRAAAPTKPTRKAMLTIGPRRISHRDRAVSAEDFEELALRSVAAGGEGRCLADDEPRAERRGASRIPATRRSGTRRARHADGSASSSCPTRPTRCRARRSSCAAPSRTTSASGRRACSSAGDRIVVRPPDYVEVERSKPTIFVTSLEQAAAAETRRGRRSRRCCIRCGADPTAPAGNSDGRSGSPTSSPCWSDRRRRSRREPAVSLPRRHRSASASSSARTSCWPAAGIVLAIKEGVAMPLEVPNLDDRRWADLVDDARALIPRVAPRWTDHNVHDPGITFIELFAWLAEMQIYQLNRVGERHREVFGRLAGVRRRPAHAGARGRFVVDGALARASRFPRARSSRRSRATSSCSRPRPS